MRKLVAMATALLGLLALAAVATAGEVTTPSGQVQSLDIAHLPNKTSRSKRRPRGVRVRVTISLRKADGSKASPTTQTNVHLPRGMILNYRQFPKCDANRLRSRGPRGCPRGSRVGRGSIKADARPVVGEVGGTVTAFNGRNNTYLIYVVPEISSPLTLVGKLRNAPEGPYGALLDVPVPLVPTLPGQPNATLTFFQITTGGTITKRRRGRRVRIPYLANPTRCIDRSYQWRFDFTYENRESARPTDAAPCAR